MPATYAHYRFGTAMLKRMPPDVLRTATRHQNLYNVGLHGPDMFFFYRPLNTTKIGKLGTKYHRQTGKEFFTRVCRVHRMNPTEEGLAYIYGVLCHYTMDSFVHPLVEKYSSEGISTHCRIESEFERYLMNLDGLEPPHGIQLAKNMSLDMPQCELIARFYPGSSGRAMRECIRDMVWVRKILELPSGPLRTTLITAGSISKNFRDMVVRPEPDLVCKALNQPLYDKCLEAVEVFPKLLDQLTAHLNYGAPLGQEFSPIFG